MSDACAANRGIGDCQQRRFANAPKTRLLPMWADTAVCRSKPLISAPRGTSAGVAIYFVQPSRKVGQLTRGSMSPTANCCPSNELLSLLEKCTKDESAQL